jgi:hypothetical protein
MALYDDAKIMFLASGAAGVDNKDFSKAPCVKPVEAVSSTDLVINGDFSIDGPGTDGALTTGFGSYGWNTVATNESTNVQEGTTTIKNGVLKLTNASGDVDCRAYITNGSNSRDVLTTNSYYKLVYTIVENDGCTDFKIYNAGAAENAPSSVGTHTRVVRTTSNQIFLFFNKTESSSISIDNVSLKEFTTRNADFDISRDANLDATRVGPTGLIEKGRENLIKYSNSFDTGSGSGGWTKTSSSVTSGQGGYDGSTDAYKLQATATGSSTNSLSQTVTLTNIVTVSVFAKAGSNVSGTQTLRLSLNEFLTSDSSQKDNSRAFFDLSDGSVVSTGGNIIATNSDSFGGGWFRLSITANIPSTNTVNKAIIFMGNGGTTINDQTNGDFFFIQDFQAEAGLVATDVITTGASTATAGIKEDEPRFDYPPLGGAPSLLIETQKGNQLSYSEYFEGWDSTSNATLTSNDAISPEGVKNATKLLATGSGNLNHQINSESLTISSVGVSASIFAKKGNTDVVRLRLNGTSNQVRAWFDLENKTTSVDSGGAATITEMNNGWFLCTVTEAGNTNTSVSLQVFINESLDQTTFVADGDEFIYIYGAQFEQGKNSTSYIPTHGVAATRSPDTLPEIDLDANGITLGTSVTVFLEASKFHASTQTSFLQLRTGTDSNNRFLFFSNTSAVGATHDINIQHRQSGTAVTNNKSGLTRGDFFKCIGRVDGTTFTMFINGEMLTPATIVAADVFDKISLIRNGDVTDQSGHKNKSVVVWDSALTDEQCRALTTL